MDNKSLPGNIKLASVTLVIALVSLGWQLTTIYAVITASSGTVNSNSIVVAVCTLSIAVTVSYLLWRSLREMKRNSRLAFIDELTGLPNRRRFDARLQEKVKASRRSGQNFGLLYLDLDRFKSINDSYGHEAGDEIIVRFGQRVAELLRDNDFIARLSGDEFAVILDSVKRWGELEQIASRIFDAMAQPIRCGNHLIYSGVSIGAAIVDDHSVSAAEILRRADFALLQAKENGRNNLQIFDPSMAERIRSRGVLESDLREAIINKRFQIKYQPLISQTENRVLGVEALVRWIHPTRGPISPTAFIPVAEEIGMIDQLGEIVLRQACMDIRDFPEMRLAVNVSPKQFNQPEFVQRVQTILAETQFDPKNLELEITEGVFITDPQKTTETILRLRKLGVGIALDDFGTGYSSMAYLRDYTLDRIKIDRSFISQVDKSGKSFNLVSRLIDLGGSLGLNVTLEGVETEDQLKLLSGSGCELQGYLFSHPVALDQLREYCSTDVALQTAKSGPVSATMHMAS